MASPLVWMQEAVSQGLAQNAYAEVAAPAPVHPTDPLYVVFPDWSRTFPFTILDWSQTIHGSALPQVGAACMIQRDTRGNLRCAWWDAATTAPSWLALSLTASTWRNQGGTGHGGASYQVAAYARDGLGWVDVRGLVSTSSPYAFGAASATVATLPANYRPGSIETFGVYQVDASSNHMIVRLDVNPDGTMTLIENELTATGVGNTGSVSYLSLAGIRFYQVN